MQGQPSGKLIDGILSEAKDIISDCGDAQSAMLSAAPRTRNITR
jgi:hypothetical protein